MVLAGAAVLTLGVDYVAMAATGSSLILGKTNKSSKTTTMTVAATGSVACGTLPHTAIWKLPTDADLFGLTTLTLRTAQYPAGSYLVTSSVAIGVGTVTLTQPELFFVTCTPNTGTIAVDQIITSISVVPLDGSSKGVLTSS